MTAVQFLKTKKRIFNVGFSLGIVGLFLVVAISCYTILRSHPHFDVIGFGCLGEVCLVILLVLGLAYAEKRFIANHPEMADLAEWISIMGSAESYPVDNVDAATMQEAFVKIITLAEYANACFVLRDAIALLINREQLLSRGVSAVLFQKTYERLAANAEVANEAYLKAWDLLIKKTSVLPADFYRDPKKYRESLLARR